MLCLNFSSLGDFVTSLFNNLLLMLAMHSDKIYIPPPSRLWSRLPFQQAFYYTRESVNFDSCVKQFVPKTIRHSLKMKQNRIKFYKGLMCLSRILL